MLTLNVNSDALIKLTNKLERINKSAFPVVVRQTLNTLAFETKKEIPAEAGKSFEIRSPGFFRAFSRVELATGFKVDGMSSKVGMTEGKRGGASEQAGRDMLQQQVGGQIGGRTFIPMDEARTSGNKKKRVRKENRITGINRIVDSKISRGRTPRQRLIKTSMYVVNKFQGDPGTVVSHTNNGKTTLYRVKRGSGKIKIRTSDGLIGLTPIYSMKRGRSIVVKAIPFVQKVSVRKAKNSDRIFAMHAEKQFKKGMS